MRIPCALLECLVVAAVTSLAIAHAAEPLSEPELGPAIFIASNVRVVASNLGIASVVHLEAALFNATDPELGPITPIADAVDWTDDPTAPSPLTFPKDDLQYHPGAEAMPNPNFGLPPIPIIGLSHPGAAPMIEPGGYGFSPGCEIPFHPDQIQFHLHALADQLLLAGLTEESKTIQDLQKNFQQKHYGRLLIEFKQSQLRMLQAEIDLLKRIQQAEVESSQIALHVHVIQLTCEGRETVLSKLDELHKSRTGIGPGHFRAANSTSHELTKKELEEIHGLVARLTKDGAAKILAEPSATILNGRTVRFLSGGECAVPAKFDANEVDGQSVSFTGANLTIKARAIDPGQVRLALQLELDRKINDPKPDAANGDDGNIAEARATSRLETIAEISSGQAVALLHTPPQCNSSEDACDSTSLLFLVATEIIQNPTPVVSIRASATAPACDEPATKR